MALTTIQQQDIIKYTVGIFGAGFGGFFGNTVVSGKGRAVFFSVKKIVVWVYCLYFQCNYW